MELNLPCCFQGLDVIMVQRERSRFPLPGAERKTEKDSARVCVCVQFPLEAVTQRGLNLRSLSSVSNTGFFSVIYSWLLQPWQKHPKYVSGNQTNVFFWCLILWETSC